MDSPAVQTQLVAAQAAVDRGVEKDRLGATRPPSTDTVLHQTVHLLPVRVNRGEISRRRNIVSTIRKVVTISVYLTHI